MKTQPTPPPMPDCDPQPPPPLAGAPTHPRIFIGLAETAGYYHGLWQGLRSHGVRCSYACLTEHPFGYGCDEQVPYVQAIRAARRARQQPGFLGLRRLAASTREKLLRWRLLRWAARHHDVFIFGYKSTFFKSFGDLAWLRRRGKRVVCIFMGSDSRPPYMDGSCLRQEHNVSPAECISLTRRQQQELATIEAHSDLIVANPYSAQLHRREFLSFFALGFPVIGSGNPVAGTPPDSGRAMRILHCPSHPESKGTERIRAAIAQLRAKGLALDYTEIINQPNRVVQDALRQCDLVVDQVFSDTPMAGLAAEAAGWGKPAVVGSYAAELFAREIPREFRPPSEVCHPDRIAEAIQTLVVDHEYRIKLGHRAREFVTTVWNHQAVAQRMIEVLTTECPEAWKCDPKKTTYLHGYGMSEARVRQQVAALLKLGGTSSLQLQDKPQLESLMVQFAAGS